MITYSTEKSLTVGDLIEQLQELVHKGTISNDTVICTQNRDDGGDYYGSQECSYIRVEDQTVVNCPQNLSGNNVIVLE